MTWLIDITALAILVGKDLFVTLVCCLWILLAADYIYIIITDTIPITDIDECQSSPCLNGKCEDLVNGHNCTCNPGWEGTYCGISKYSP